MSHRCKNSSVTNVCAYTFLIYPQVDVSFFTSPVTASARTAVPKQRVPSKSKMLPPAPELSTPRELAAASQRPSSSHAMSGIEPTVTPAPSILPAPIPALPVLANAPVTPKPHTEMFPQIDETPPGLGQKRPAEDGQAAGPAPKRRAPPAAERPAPKPKLPPVREKKKPSIFMPSKVGANISNFLSVLKNRTLQRPGAR